jgi:hypothetical protein
MATQLQLRQGNTAQTAVFTGVIAEVTVDTDQKTLTIHDGTTVGGNYLITKSQLESNVSIIAGINSTQNTNITAVNQFAQSAFNTANGANGLAAGAYSQANTNADAIVIIQGVDLTQNTQIAGLQGVDLAQNTSIIAVNDYAGSAFNKANVGGTFTGNVIIQQNLLVDKNLIVTGNLIISGNTTSISANNLVIDDPLIILANNNILDVIDIGFIAHYDEFEPGEYRHTGLIRHAEDNEYYIFYNYDKHIHSQLGSNNIIDVLDSSFLLSNVNGGYFKGNLIASTAVIGGTDFANYVTLVQGVNNTQNTRLNSIETVNVDQNTSITIIQGVNNTQNTRLNSIETVNSDQNTAISIIQSVDLTQNTNITNAINLAQAAFDQANTGVPTNKLTSGTKELTLFANGVISLPEQSAFYNNTTTFSTNTNDQILDSFNAVVYRTAKYLIQGIDGSDVQSTEVILTHNDTDVYISEYGTIGSANTLYTVSGSLLSGIVSLTVSPTNSDTTFDFVRTSIVARTLSGGLEGDLMSQTGTEDLNEGSGTEDLNT